jgi:tRNA 2-thiouridine synthesizing protein A
MTEIQTVDARGLSCPEPALMTRQALQKAGQGKVVVLVDAITARDNVARTARMAGWQAEIQPQEDNSFQLILTK